jgi:hypothetical protein
MSFNNLGSNKFYLILLYLKLIRFRHWVKNLFIFIPLFFSGEFFDIDKFLITTFVFISFSLITSLIYIINDIFDFEFDKNHSCKKQRPIASGQISTKLEVKNGVLTGRFSTLNCNGQEKVIRIKEKYDLIIYDEIHVFGNSKGDFPMLDLGTHKYYKYFK